MKNTARLFIAAALPSNMVRELSALAIRLERDIRANFSRVENYHITLAFLGETDWELTPEICAILDGMQIGATEISLAGLGSFGKPNGAVLWCGLSGARPLEELSVNIRAALREREIPFDPKPMKPHITLARNAKLQDIDLSQYQPHASGKIERVSLFVSERKKGVLTYTPL